MGGNTKKAKGRVKQAVGAITGDKKLQQVELSLQVKPEPARPCRSSGPRDAVAVRLAVNDLIVQRGGTLMRSSDSPPLNRLRGPVDRPMLAGCPSRGVCRTTSGGVSGAT